MTIEFGLAFASSIAIDHDASIEICRRAEAAGFESLWGGEHVIMPSTIESSYPYTKDGKIPAQPDTPIPDPLIWLTWVAAQTTRIKLATGILIVPQRNPVITAKELATLDHLSGGRMVLGVGAGWLAEEFDALNASFGDRGKRLDEYVAIMRALWSGTKTSFDGEFFDFTDCISLPRPPNGTIPVIVGGHSKTAARRAARIGDGFFPGSASIDELSELFTIVRRTAEDHGRDPDSIELIAGAGAPPGPKLDTRIEQLAEIGVTHAIVPTFPPDSLADIGQQLVATYG